jgi:peroxiredoxin family protein
LPKLTLVVFSDELDRAIAAFLIASRAAAEGWEVVMLFTFWGLAILRDPDKKVKGKVGIEKRIDASLPRGADELRLTHMHMLGLGTAAMKKRMDQKKVLPVREMMKEAKEFGVRIVACSLPMELMGIRREEMVDEVDDVCSVGDYLEEAKDADVNIFV